MCRTLIDTEQEVIAIPKETHVSCEYPLSQLNRICSSSGVLEEIDSIPASENVGIVAKAGPQGIVPRPAVQHVITVQCFNQVVPTQSQEDVIAARPTQIIIAGSSGPCLRSQRCRVPHGAVCKFYPVDLCPVERVRPTGEDHHIGRAVDT